MSDPLYPSEAESAPGVPVSRLYTGRDRVRLPNWAGFLLVVLVVFAVWQQVELRQLKQSVTQGVYVTGTNDSADLQQLRIQIQGLQDCVVSLKTKSAAAAADDCPTTN